MIIGISGRKGSGKDLVGEIIQYLTSPNVGSKGTFLECKEQGYVYDVIFENKKFADKLKDMVCLLIGCTREQLEDQEFKAKSLGEEWTVYEDHIDSKAEVLLGDGSCKLAVTLTPRKILQLLGTEGVRDIIHPNAWVNSLMVDYKSKLFNRTTKEEYEKGKPIVWEDGKYPNWIITDMRFPNELKAIEDKKGITIRVERPKFIECTCIRHEESNGCFHCDYSGKIEDVESVDNHSSETALDNAEFDYIIENSGSVVDLVDMVKQLLLDEGILKE